MYLSFVFIDTCMQYLNACIQMYTCTAMQHYQWKENWALFFWEKTVFEVESLNCFHNGHGPPSVLFSEVIVF